MTTAEIIDRLQQATHDLVWVSESDYPFEVVRWERGTELNPAVLFAEAGADAAPIVTMTLAEFFAPAVTTEDWYAADELAHVDRCKQLQETIATSLVDVRVFRVGEIEITVYLIGKTPDGELVGVKTQEVET